MIFAGIIIAGLVAYIGFSLIKDADNLVGVGLGVFLMLLAGGIICLATGGPKTVGYIAPDQKCAQVAWLDESWKCVPVEEAG